MQLAQFVRTLGLLLVFGLAGSVVGCGPGAAGETPPTEERAANRGFFKSKSSHKVVAAPQSRRREERLLDAGKVTDRRPRRVAPAAEGKVGSECRHASGAAHDTILAPWLGACQKKLNDFVANGVQFDCFMIA